MMPEPRNHGTARAKIWRDCASLEGRRTAAVGAFRCGTAEDGATLLRAVARDLAKEGFGAVVGPMDGDTWHSYRLITESDGSPPFLLEPSSGPHDRAAFQAAGFEPVGRYFSARARVADALGPAPVPVSDLVVQSWDGDDPKAQFREVFAVSEQAFSKNAFYAPISQNDFLAMYLPLVPMLRPELILMARHEGRLVGFLFGIPNYQEGRAPASVILKTYASLMPGAGHALSHAFHRAAHSAGFETVIHALIHETNASADRSRRHGAVVFRRYALMGLRL